MPTKKKINRKVNRKRKESLKKIGLTLLYFVSAILIGAGSYFLYQVFFPKPLYISPLSKSSSLNSASQSNRDNDAFTALLKGNKFDFAKISTTDSTYTVDSKDGSVVVFSRQKDLQLQFSSLQLILSRLTMEGKQFSRLDLRFDKPVIILRR